MKNYLIFSVLIISVLSAGIYIYMQSEPIHAPVLTGISVK